MYLRGSLAGTKAGNVALQLISGTSLYWCDTYWKGNTVFGMLLAISFLKIVVQSARKISTTTEPKIFLRALSVSTLTSCVDIFVADSIEVTKPKLS